MASFEPFPCSHKRVLILNFVEERGHALLLGPIESQTDPMAQWCKICGALRYKVPDGSWTDWLLPEREPE